MVQLSDMKWKVEIWNGNDWERPKVVGFSYFDMHKYGNGLEHERKQNNKFIKLKVGQSLIYTLTSDWIGETLRVTRVR